MQLPERRTATGVALAALPALHLRPQPHFTLRQGHTVSSHSLPRRLYSLLWLCKCGRWLRTERPPPAAAVTSIIASTRKRSASQVVGSSAANSSSAGGAHRDGDSRSKAMRLSFDYGLGADALGDAGSGGGVGRLPRAIFNSSREETSPAAKQRESR